MTADEQVPGDGFRCRIAAAGRPQLVLSVLIRSDRTVDRFIGAFYLIRAATFEALGGFDERFFVCLEDLDLPALWRASR